MENISVFFWLKIDQITYIILLFLNCKFIHCFCIATILLCCQFYSEDKGVARIKRRLTNIADPTNLTSGTTKAKYGRQAKVGKSCNIYKTKGIQMDKLT